MTAPKTRDRSLLIIALHGKVAALDAETGEVRWKNGLTAGGYGEVEIAFVEDALVVSAFGARLFCLDYLTGAERWAVDTTSAGHASIIVEAGRIFVAKAGVVDCFDLAGNRLWSQLLTGIGTGHAALGFHGNLRHARGEAHAPPSTGGEPPRS
ncbi:MAG: PQQ-binding-like beta-propeller repeat protein [Polyangiaceae bacterium]|nr:PQQ-binding-like beta-propeller repeat protein [Polyangiaceae bacterium]